MLQLSKNMLLSGHFKLYLIAILKQHLKQATNLAKAIKDMTGYNTFVAKRGNEIVVCAGKFNFKDSSELKKALKGISKLEYEGKKQFASSYPIQIR